MPKIRLTFKTPDVMDQVREEVKEDVKNKKKFREDDEHEESWEDDEDEIEERLNHLSITIFQFVRNREYVTIEFDTDEDTARVIEVL